MLKEKQTTPIAWPCFESKENKALDYGEDSRVFRFGEEFVLKTYRGVSEDRLSLYFKTTNYASEELEKNKLFLSLPFSKQSFEVTVNPFLEKRICDNCGNTKGLAPFVSGERLDKLNFRFDHLELFIALRTLSGNLMDLFGVIGINIIPKNAKLGMDDTIIVTDLCSSINNLNRKYS
ncbi:hypothetical protein ACFL1Q_00380 [Patescibacteria group bacterium]